MNTPQADRIAWLDALRGFALIGIFVANLPALAGYVFLSPDARAALWFDGGAGVLQALAAVFVDAKFYSVFSFLFGIGLALQIGDAPRLRRRLGVLFVIGLAHAWLVWWGDILCLYALLGLAVVALRPSPVLALRLGVALLAAPVLVYVVYVIAGLEDPLAAATSSGPPPVFAAAASGTPVDVVQSNVLMSVGAVVRRVLRFQVLRVSGMFLIGYWFASRMRGEAGANAPIPAFPRRGKEQGETPHAPFPRVRGKAGTGAATHARLRRWIVWGFALGVPLNLAYWWMGGGDRLFPAQPQMLLGVAAASLGIPLLALAYVGVFGLFWSGDARSWLVAAGRMPLTNYLMQSVLGVLIFYGFAGGLWAQLGRAQLLMLSLVLAMLQLAASAWWLQRYRSGPVEALWRWLVGLRLRQPVLER